MPSTSDPSDRRYEATFDPAGDSASEAVLEAVGAAAGVDPLELEPLYAVVDPDAIDALCAYARRRCGRRRSGQRSSKGPSVRLIDRFHLSSSQTRIPHYTLQPM